MRRIKHISFALILVGFIAMSLHAITPHHHHNDSVCFDLEITTGETCDATEHNHSTKNECPNSQECNAKNPFISRTNNNDTTDSDKYIHFHSKILFECTQLVSYFLNEQFSSSKVVYNLFIQKDYCCYIIKSGGLRAPPYFIA